MPQKKLPIEELNKLAVIGAGGLGFDSRAKQIGHNIANDSQSLRKFCIAQALSRRDRLRHSLDVSGNTAIIMKI